MYKNQHIIPRVYLKGWEFDRNQRKVLIKKKSSENWEEIKTNNNFFTKKNYYSYNIKNMGLNEDNLKILLKPLKYYEVCYNNKILDYDNKNDLKDMQLIYDEFMDWRIICKASRKELSSSEKEKLSDEIYALRDLNIEKRWNIIYESKYLDLLNNIDKIIQNKTLNLKSNIKTDIISLICMFNYRKESGDTKHSELTDNFIQSVLGLVDDEIFPFKAKQNFANEIKQDEKLREYYNHLNYNEGRITDSIEYFSKNKSITFIVPKKNAKFITGDSPSSEWVIDGIEYPYMVMSPNVIIQLDPLRVRDICKIKEIDYSEVQEYNERIAEKCEEYIIKYK